MINSCKDIELIVVNTNTTSKYISVDVQMVDKEVPDDFMIDKDYTILFMYDRIEFRLQERNYTVNGLLDSMFAGDEYKTKHIFFNHPNKNKPSELDNMTVLKLLLKSIILMPDKQSRIRDEFLTNIKTKIREHGLKELEK